MSFFVLYSDMLFVGLLLLAFGVGFSAGFGPGIHINPIDIIAIVLVTYAVIKKYGTKKGRADQSRLRKLLKDNGFKV